MKIIWSNLIFCMAISFLGSLAILNIAEELNLIGLGTFFAILFGVGVGWFSADLGFPMFEKEDEYEEWY